MRGPRRRDSLRLIAAYLLAALLAVGFVWAEAERTAAQPLGGAFLFPEGPSPAGGMQFGMHLGETPGVFRWHAPLAAGVRAGAVPLEFRWDVVEPAPGRFEWTRYNQAVDALQAHGLHVVGVLHYPADLPPPGRASRAGWPSAHVDDWDYFVHRVVSRYGGEIRDWVVVRGRAGAPDPLFGAAEADVDVQLIRIAAAALRRALPGARLWAVAPGADLRWLELFMARGGLRGGGRPGAGRQSVAGGAGRAGAGRGGRPGAGRPGGFVASALGVALRLSYPHGLVDVGTEAAGRQSGRAGRFRRQSPRRLVVGRGVGGVLERAGRPVARRLRRPGQLRIVRERRPRQAGGVQRTRP